MRREVMHGLCRIEVCEIEAGGTMSLPRCTFAGRVLFAVPCK